MSKEKIICLVPVEPTQEMLKAGQDAWLKDPAKRSSTLYQAMLAAAPAVQGEPVAYLRKDQLDKVRRNGPMLGEIAGSPRADRVPVYAAPQPAPDTALAEAFDAGRRAAQVEAAEFVVALEELIAPTEYKRDELPKDDLKYGDYASWPLQVVRLAWQASRAAPAVQGEPIPAGFALIKLDSRTGKPLVTSEMKAKHIGKYWWDEEAPYYDEHGDLHDYVARHAVPWSLCKEIYKNMASAAMLAAQPADQQPAPEVAMLVEALSRCRHQASYSIGGEDALRVQLEKVRDIVSETLHALAAYHNQGGES